MSLKFIKNKENFVCEHCGVQVLGTGYTNHCPECFYSKHVDINPGDRANVCGGLMAPIAVRPYRHGWRIMNKCLKCGLTHENKTSNTDNIERLVDVVKKINLNFRVTQDTKHVTRNM